MNNPNDFLFEKVYFQAAHIAILDEALETARRDIKQLAKRHDINVDAELTRIKIAYESVAKLKQGITK